MRPSMLLLLLLLLASAAAAAEVTQDFNGHTKLAALAQSPPDGADMLDIASSLRLNYSARGGRWSFETAYELFALHGEQNTWPGDAARLLDLSDILRARDKTLIAQRLDRLWFGYTSEQVVLRVGRQALSWGNGLFFTPMDLVNPFNPAAVDTEFKSGDDLLYAQYLRDNGDDLQGAHVLRRNPATGEADARLATTALKYHGVLGDSEYDLLLADSYGAQVLGLGAAHSIRGAIWRADLVITDAAGGSTVQLVSNLSYGWTWRGKNVSGALEYYNDDGTDYIAGSLMLEMSPLWTVTPTILAEASDAHALLQLISNYSLADNMRLLGSLNLPLGADGPRTADMPGLFPAIDWSLFAQFAWYF